MTADDDQNLDIGGSNGSGAVKRLRGLAGVVLVAGAAPVAEMAWLASISYGLWMVVRAL